MKTPLALLPLLLLGATVPLAAQNEPPPSPTPANAPADKAQMETITGEITEMRPDGFEIRPWNPMLPRRMEVRLGPETRYFRQYRGSRRALAPGQFVLLVHENTLASTKTIQLQPRGNQDPGRKPSLLKAVAVLRFPEVKEVTREERQTARLLLDSALPYFKGSDQGGADPPRKGNHPIVGRLDGLDPLSIHAAGETHEFKPAGDMLVIDTVTASSSDLKKGVSVFLKCSEPVRPAPPGTVPPRVGDHPVLADVVSFGPTPHQSLREQRKFILREEGKLKPSDTLK